MYRTGPQTNRERVNGLLVALLALGVVASVSPVYTMPGCTMPMAPFDFGCEHGIITRHITEMPTAAAGFAIAALAMMASLALPKRPALFGRTVPLLADAYADDPLGERMRT